MTSKIVSPLAPELQVSRWINTDKPITLAALRGRVVVIEAFQMLCPGCVAHGLPQALEIANTFPTDDVAVLGLHTVFEHHTAMQPHALEAFLYEYGIPFPVGIDAPAEAGEGPVPKTMSRYNLRGTPSLLIIDQAGHLRANLFGQARDMQVAAEIAKLVLHRDDTGHEPVDDNRSSTNPACTSDGCTL